MSAFDGLPDRDEIDGSAELHVDPTDDSAWRDAEDVLTEAERIERGGKKPSEAPLLTGFTIGHTIALDDNGAKPLLVLGLEMVDVGLGVGTTETVVLAPEAGRLVIQAIHETLLEMGEPTVRDLRRVDL